MTTAQVVERSVTNKSLSKDYPHPDDHTRQTTLVIQPSFRAVDELKHVEWQTFEQPENKRKMYGSKAWVD